MFQFLNPVWFIGAAAILIPVLIHLWNIRPGKVLKVGSISLVAAASRKSSRSFKILDIPLFLVRCLLLVLLALLLALPVWQKIIQPAKTIGWLLIPQENFKATYQQFKPAIDSLTRIGYEFHYFNTGFPKSSIRQILSPSPDSASTAFIAAPSKTSTNYWNLIKQLNSQVASNLSVQVFTPNKAAYFTGTKPAVALQLKWQAYTPADSVNTWIHDAWFTNAGDIRVVQANSKPSGTVYTYKTARSANDPVYAVQTNNGQAQISLTGSKEAPVSVDATTQSIYIYTDNNTLDAGYLKAALQAVNQFTQRKTILKLVRNPAQVPANTAWLFWLSDKPLRTSLANRCQYVLAYQDGKPATVNSWITNNDPFMAVVPDDSKVDLFKVIIASEGIRTLVWRNGFGQPVLSQQQQGTTQVYHFYSRFNPAWNDLVWSNAFPAWLLSLSQHPASTTNKTDNRILSKQQYMPQIINEAHTASASKQLETKSLMRYFWLAVLLAFAAERWLAHRSLQTQNA